MRFCPECKKRTEERLCPDDETPTLLESAFGKAKVDPLVGRTFDDRYEILERIGKGGMGSVYRARQLAMGREVALKVLNPDLAEDAEAAGRFVREAKVASRLRHPNTIVIHDFGHTEDGLFMALELLTGDTLQERLKRGPMAPREAATFAAAIARSLAEAHDIGVVHRDLKPANVFMHQVHGGTEVTKVLDFGIAKFVQEARTTAGEPTGFETNRPMVLGTIHYMAPEQVRAGDVDGRADLYALGIILYEALVGKRPFDGDSAIVTLRMHLEEPPPTLPIETPAPLRRLVESLLQKKAVDRPASGATVAAALDDYLTGKADESAPKKHSAARVRKLETQELLASTQRAAPEKLARFQSHEIDLRNIEPNAISVESATAAQLDGEDAMADGWRFEPEPKAEVLKSKVAATMPAAVTQANPKRKRDKPVRGSAFLGLGILFLAIVGAYAWLDIHAPGALSDDPGKIRITTAPPGAAVADTRTGLTVGTTPMELSGGDSAPAEVTLTLTGYRAEKRRLSYPDPGLSRTIDVPLSRTPRIALTTTPPGAEVTWKERGAIVGTSPTTWAVPEAALKGSVAVTLIFRKPGFDERSEVMRMHDLAAGRGMDIVLTPHIEPKKRPKRVNR